jgi:hypothetical protein
MLLLINRLVCYAKALGFGLDYVAEFPNSGHVLPV